MIKSIIAILVVLFCVNAFGEIRVERIQHQFCQRNQGETSTCWLHSAVQLMEQAARTEFSIDALAVHEIKSRALIRKRGLETEWDAGAGPTRPFALALEHGLVPADVYQAEKSLILNYSEVFEKVEVLLDDTSLNEKAFLSKVDEVLLSYLGSLPPKEFYWRGKRRTPTELSSEIIGNFPSFGYDFRDVEFDDSIFKKMGEIAWTTVIGRNSELVKITDIIKKHVVRLNADQAWDKLIEKFEAKIPMAFTFIYWDQDGRDGRTFEVNDRREFISARPPAQTTYTASHLVLVTGLVYENDEVVAIEVLGPIGFCRFRWNIYCA